MKLKQTNASAPLIQ